MSVADLEASLKTAGEIRTAQSRILKASAADQSNTIRVVKQALARLQEFDRGKSFGQTAVRDNHHKSMEVVMESLAIIIQQAGLGNATATADEGHQQDSYDQFKHDAMERIKASRAMLAKKQSAAKETESRWNETKQALHAGSVKLEGLAASFAAVEAECGPLLRNFDASQRRRQQEM